MEEVKVNKIVELGKELYFLLNFRKNIFYVRMISSWD